MEKWKDYTQYGTAVTAFASGLALAFLQYFDMGDLTNGVLGYVAQVLVYAASVFGVTMYWNGKYRETMNIVNERYNKLEEKVDYGRRSTNMVSSSSK